MKATAAPSQPVAGLRMTVLQSVKVLWRLPLLGAAILGLLGAIWAGWLRIGWQLPALQPSLAGAHAPLMISGFFATLIGIERAVALGRPLAYLAPLLSGLGGLLLLFGVDGPLPPLLLVAGSFGLAAMLGWILLRHPALYVGVMALGGAALALGNALWVAGWPVYRVVLLWAAFLILTIAGERLELGRLMRRPKIAGRLFLVATAAFSAGLGLSLFVQAPGVRLASLGLVGLAAWLLHYDIARKTIRQQGLPRFAAICLLSGYAWLGAAGLLGLAFGLPPAGFQYDAILHSIFLGFVFAMIFAHAPIIFPAILGLPIRYSPVSYLPLVLLHASLLARVAGDLLFLPALRLAGGISNGITILLFLVLTILSILPGLRGKTGASGI